MRRSHRAGFQWGRKPTFDCAVCGRRTRPVDCDHLCPECWELAGWDNHHNDNDIAPTEKEMKFYNSLLAKAVKKGGDAESIKNCNEFIFRKGVEARRMEERK